MSDNCVYRKKHDCKRYRSKLQKPVYQNCLHIAPANSYKISRITCPTTDNHLLMENLKTIFVHFKVRTSDGYPFNFIRTLYLYLKPCILYF